MHDVGMATPGQRAAARAVKARRGELGLTQRALAKLAGVHFRTLQDFERGATWPQSTTLAQLERLGLQWPVGRIQEIADSYNHITAGEGEGVPDQVQHMRDLLTEAGENFRAGRAGLALAKLRLIGDLIDDLEEEAEDARLDAIKREVAALASPDEPEQSPRARPA